MVPASGEAGAMMRVMMIVLVSVALTGCSAEVWHRPGASEQEARADTAVCQYAAARSSEGSGVVYEQVASYNYFNNCMAARGYLVSVY
jgi:hypothetical protein